MSDASRTENYPRYCFHLSPTLNAWCPLRASEIHGLEQHAGFEGECAMTQRLRLTNAVF